MDMIISARTSAIVRQLALYVAKRAFRTWAREQGYRLRDISAGTVDRAARAWLAQHPEAYELAAEKVRNSPKLRAMAERETRERARAIQKTLRQAQAKSPTTPMLANAVAGHTKMDR
jgi:hypothetical protein